MFGIEITPALIWIVVAVIFGIIEIVTLGIMTIWFAVGAVAAAILASLGVGFIWQFAAFLFVSIVLLYFTRPIAEKYLKIGKQKTNAESLIGELAVIVEETGPNKIGQARVRGQMWSCEAADKNEVFVKDEEVIIERIEGVRLLIKRGE